MWGTEYGYPEDSEWLRGAKGHPQGSLFAQSYLITQSTHAKAVLLINAINDEVFIEQATVVKDRQGNQTARRDSS